MSNEAYDFNTYEMSGTDATLSEKFEGAATVGNKVIFAPHKVHDPTANPVRIGIFDITSKSFEINDSIPSGSLERPFSGATTVDGKVIFTPFDSPLVVSYDPATDSVDQVSINVTNFQDQEGKFRGAAAAGNQVVFAPYDALTEPIFLVRSAIGTYDGTFELFDNEDDGGFENRFYGAAAVGNKVVFAPFNQNPNGDTTIGLFDAETNKVTDGPVVTNMVDGAFAGAVAVGNFVYFVPYNSDFILRYDCDTKEIKEIGRGTMGNGLKEKFRGAAVIEEHIVFIPYNTKVIGIYDTRNDVFDVFGLPQSVTQSQDLKFFSGGAAVDGNKVVFAPYNADKVGVFEIDLAKIRKIRDDKDNNLPLILGLSLGLGIPILIVVIFYIYKASKK